MNTESKLRTILAYEFSGERSFPSCDIETRDRINRLIPKLFRAFNAPTPAGYKQRAERISGLVVGSRGIAVYK